MKNLTYCLLLAVLCYFATAAPKVSVITPHQLSSKFDDDIPFAIAKYGKIPYGAHFIGGLALAKPVNGCGKIDYFVAGELTFDHNVIAVVRQGGCAPIVKTRNAQNAGAKMVILVSESDDKLPSIFGVGSDAEDITIPTILIPKKEGEQIIKFIEKLPFPPLNPEDIVPIVSINFPYDFTSETVALDFWFSSSDFDGTSYKFINDITPYILTDKAFQFTPHFVTWDCLICKKLDYMVPLTGDCISGGRYCAPDPDEEGPLTGNDILYEDLRQACLWKESKDLWFAYISLYPTSCLKSDGKTKTPGEAEKCSKDQMASILSPSEQARIENCVKSSFVKTKAGDNSPVDYSMDDNKILAAEKELQLQYDITEFPVLLINHKPYSESLADIRSVLGEICWNVKNPPLICRDVGVGYKSSHGLNIVLTLMVVLLVSAMIILFCYRRLTKRDLGKELSTEANNMVSRYMAMKDTAAMMKESEDDEVAVGK